MKFPIFFACCAVLVAAAPNTLPGAQPKFDGDKDVTFNLYTQGNPTTPEYIKLADDSKSPSFNPNNPTRFVIHGGGSNASNLLGYKDAYIQTGLEYNVVLVDWSGPSHDPQASLLAISTGEYVGQVINHLIANRGLNPDDLVIVGHSLGGIVAGVTGNRVGGRAAEIIALDPAIGSPDGDMENQLDALDAKFVQVIYTKFGSNGSQEWIGDVFFYPNGGTYQVGCSQQDEMIEGCSHNRAPLYFAESIVSKKFVATACSSYENYEKGLCSSNEHIVMGEWTPTNIYGSYFLDTNQQAPFGQGKTDL